MKARARSSDLLTADHDVIVRYNGGANAGHTVVIGDEKYALHLLPSGILSRGKICVIGNGVVVDPETLLSEIEGIRSRGIEINADNLLISDRAHVVMPYHKEHDAALERVLSSAADDSGPGLSIGTTRRGIGPAYADKVHRSLAIRMGELADADHLRSRLEVICAIRTRELNALGVNAPPLDPHELADRYSKYGQLLERHITDTVYALHDFRNSGQSILFEGANAWPAGHRPRYVSLRHQFELLYPRHPSRHGTLGTMC